ncbi:MAG: hypothetical protein QG657_5115 [Acidobacteriota bacterium]|nr:hypothetical protein [Acidobacteriota bacterium]
MLFIGLKISPIKGIAFNISHSQFSSFFSTRNLTLRFVDWPHFIQFSGSVSYEKKVAVVRLGFAFFESLGSFLHEGHLLSLVSNTLEKQ